MPDAKPTAPSQPSPPQPSSPPHAPQESSGAPVAVDLQAEIQKALEAERERWRQQLKETLGVDSLEAWKEQRLKEEGKLQELLQQKEQEATHYRQQFERLAIQNALLTAARNAVDPGKRRSRNCSRPSRTLLGQPVTRAPAPPFRLEGPR